MFSLFNEITFDPNSGRPIAPIYWRAIVFYVVMAWLFAVLMLVCMGLAIRDDQPVEAVTFGFVSVVIVSVAHWQKRQIDKEKAQFQQMVAAYERMIIEASS